MDECCGHPIPLGDCGCRGCHCATAAMDGLDLDLPVPALVVEPVDLDAFLEEL